MAFGVKVEQLLQWIGKVVIQDRIYLNYVMEVFQNCQISIVCLKYTDDFGLMSMKRQADTKGSKQSSIDLVRSNGRNGVKAQLAISKARKGLSIRTLLLGKHLSI
jgi:hypothetical protein